jgi:hypothetical protein
VTGAARGVTIGTAIISYIEPHPGQAVAFNRWYEQDHFPATVKAGPGVFAAQRFVATRACKAHRPPGHLLGEPKRGSYLGVAWVLPGKQGEWDAWIASEMETIADEGRLFAGRDHVHTAVYRFIEQSGTVDAIVALDRGFQGVVVAAGARDVPLLDLPCVVVLEIERTILSEAEPPEHRLVLGFCDADPIAVFERSAPLLADSGFASPFLATRPGTDDYADDL